MSNWPAAGSLYRVTLLIFLLVMGTAAETVAQDPTAEIQQASIDQVIEQLGADTFAARQQAMREIVQRDVEAVEPLKLAAIESSGDSEKQMRAVAVIARLAVAGEQECQRAARNALTELIASEDQNLRTFALASQSRLSEVMHDVAIAQLRELGAEVDSSTYREGQRQVTRYEVTIDEKWKGKLDDFNLTSLISRMDHLNLFGPEITDEVIDQVAGANLRTLRIKRSSITNAAIDRIRKIDSLRRLDIYYSDIDDGCVDDLGAMTQLRQIRLWGTKISPENTGTLAQRLDIRISISNGAFLGIQYERNEQLLRLTRVVKDSAAERGGLQVGDVIVYFSDREITELRDFGLAIQARRAGDKVKTVVQRDGKEVELEIELGQFPDRDR